jgi:chromate transport protein ChrA
LPLCAFLPGGNMVNFAVIFGARMRGPLGALAAVAGLLGPPMILIIAVGALYTQFGDLPALRRMLTGVAAAAAGLMLATVAKMMARRVNRQGTSSNSFNSQSFSPPPGDRARSPGLFSTSICTYILWAGASRLWR